MRRKKWIVSKKGLSLTEVIVIVLIVGVLAAILLPALARRRETKNRIACAGNLKQLGMALYLYSQENIGYAPVDDWGVRHVVDLNYPPVDHTKNNFMFDADFLFPEYLNDPIVAMCPGDSRMDPDTTFRLTSDHPIDGTPKGQVHPDCFTDSSYIYLGWMVMADKEIEAFFEAYDKLPVEDYDAKINVPKGRGTLEGDTIHRLSFGVERFLFTDINSIGSDEVGSAMVPIIWDRPYTDTARSSHRPVGGNVLYLDGHVSYCRYEGIGFWGYNPLSKTMARLLEERPREPIPHCERK
jgi:prepilin-type processing-associated H-X9-DG protein